MTDCKRVARAQHREGEAPAEPGRSDGLRLGRSLALPTCVHMRMMSRATRQAHRDTAVLTVSRSNYSYTCHVQAFTSWVAQCTESGFGAEVAGLAMRNWGIRLDSYTFSWPCSSRVTIRAAAPSSRSTRAKPFSAPSTLMAVLTQSAVVACGATVVTPMRFLKPSPLRGSMICEYRSPLMIADRYVSPEVE